MDQEADIINPAFTVHNNLPETQTILEFGIHSMILWPLQPLPADRTL